MFDRTCSNDFAAPFSAGVPLQYTGHHKDGSLSNAAGVHLDVAQLRKLRISCVFGVYSLAGTMPVCAFVGIYQLDGDE